MKTNEDYRSIIEQRVEKVAKTSQEYYGSEDHDSGLWVEYDEAMGDLVTACMLYFGYDFGFDGYVKA